MGLSYVINGTAEAEVVLTGCFSNSTVGLLGPLKAPLHGKSAADLS